MNQNLVTGASLRVSFITAPKCTSEFLKIKTFCAAADDDDADDYDDDNDDDNGDDDDDDDLILPKTVSAGVSP